MCVCALVVIHAWFLGYGPARQIWADALILIPVHLTIKDVQKFIQPAETRIKSCEILHTTSNTRIACWHVCTLGSFSDQNAQLLATIDSVNNKTALLALSETPWSVLLSSIMIVVPPIMFMVVPLP